MIARDSATLIEPIDARQERQVEHATREWIHHARRLFRIPLEPIPVRFDLQGRAAGMYRVTRGKRIIRYNPYLFAKYFEESLTTTVPHEVAHYVADILHGLHTIRPHGPEWRAIMRAFGVEPRATERYDLSGIPVRRQRQFDYQCRCGTHPLSTTRHNKIRRNQAVYFCKRCGERLVRSP